MGESRSARWGVKPQPWSNFQGPTAASLGKSQPSSDCHHGCKHNPHIQIGSHIYTHHVGDLDNESFPAFPLEVKISNQHGTRQPAWHSWPTLEARSLHARLRLLLPPSAASAGRQKQSVQASIQSLYGAPLRTFLVSLDNRDER